jgi:transcriptional regulator of acetoin/glycerol metabolism
MAGALPDERARIAQALADTGWNVAKAARRLGIGRTTLYERIAQFGLQRPAE